MIDGDDVNQADEQATAEQLRQLADALDDWLDKPHQDDRWRDVQQAMPADWPDAYRHGLNPACRVCGGQSWHDDISEFLHRADQLTRRGAAVTDPQPTAADRAARRMEIMTAIIVVNGLLNWVFTLALRS